MSTPESLSIVSDGGAFDGCTAMLSAAESIVAASGIIVPTNVQTIKLPRECREVMVFFAVTGSHALNNANLDLYLEVTPNPDATTPRWFRQSPITVAVLGATTCDTDPDASQRLDISHIRGIRLGAVNNKDAAKAVTVQAYLFWRPYPA